jgi:hypothetical protein
MTKIEGGEVAIIVALAYWDTEPFSGQKEGVLLLFSFIYVPMELFIG